MRLIERHRLRIWEPLPWLLAIAGYFAFPNYLGFGTELLVAILFALSLDLALGYAGIITLGHAAFFGAGAYTVGMLSYHGIWTEPITSLLARRRGGGDHRARLRPGAAAHHRPHAADAHALHHGAARGSGQHGPRLYRRLRRAAEPAPSRRCSGIFEFNPLYSNTQYLYVLAVLFICFVFVRTLVYSPFGQSLTGIRENMLRMHAVGAPVRARLVTCYTISAAIAGIAGGLWAQASAYVNLSALSLDRAATVLIMLILGGYGRLYGAFVGAVAYMLLSHFSRQILSDRLAARARPPAGGDRAVRAQRHSRHCSTRLCVASRVKRNQP